MKNGSAIWEIMGCAVLLAVLLVAGCQQPYQLTGKIEVDWCYFEDGNRVIHRIDPKATDCTQKGGHWITNGQADFLRQGNSMALNKNSLPPNSDTPPSMGYCVVGGYYKYINTLQCAAKGGKSFGSASQARDSLGLEPEVAVDEKSGDPDDVNNNKIPSPSSHVAKPATTPSPTSSFGANMQRGTDAYNRGDYATALKELKPLAERGDALAQYFLGHMYEKGNGVPQNNAKAIRWYRLAANQGQVNANIALGYLDFPASKDYQEGREAYGREDYATALKKYKPLAEQGDDRVQLEVGLMYEWGEGVSRDYAEAMKWYRLAAQKGNSTAQYHLGEMYEKGKGVSQNNAEAIKWYQLAADKGEPNAQSKIKKLEPKIAPQIRTKPSPPTPPDIAKPSTAVSITFPTKPIDVHFSPSSIRPDDIAVIIGNANYETGVDIPNVTPAYADAEGMKRYVRQALGVAEGNIIFLKDAAQKDMIATFGTGENHKGKLFRYLVPGKSRVFVYYAGHGAPGEENSNYLVPVNAEASLIELNGYPIKTLYRNLSKLPAKSVTVVLEACFSGASEAGSIINNASPVYLKAKDTRIPPNLTVISAGAVNQIASWEKDKSHSLFTKYFLKGMSGEADENKDSKVSWAELKNYLAKTVTRFALRYYGRDQTAQIVVGSGG